MSASLVGSEMCIRDRSKETVADIQAVLATKPLTKPEDQSKASKAKGSAAPASEAAGSKRRRKE
eukprot:1166819-Alexandrium_andersonii.AAC.1